MSFWPLILKVQSSWSFRGFLKKHLCFQLNFWPFMHLRFRPTNYWLFQFISNGSIELLTTYFEALEFIRLWGFFYKKIVLLIELLTFHAHKVQTCNLLTISIHSWWLNWASDHLCWGFRIHRTLGFFNNFFVLLIEILTFHAHKVQVCKLLTTSIHSWWFNWASDHLFWRPKVHRTLGCNHTNTRHNKCNQCLVFHI